MRGEGGVVRVKGVGEKVKVKGNGSEGSMIKCDTESELKWTVSLDFCPLLWPIMYTKETIRKKKSTWGCFHTQY